MTTIGPTKRFGASIQPKYVHRDVPIYGVSKIELSQLSNFNNTSSTYFSLSGVLIGYAVGIWTNAAFNDGSMTPLGVLATKFLAPGMCLIALAFVYLAFQARKQRNELVSHLTAEEISGVEG